MPYIHNGRMVDHKPSPAWYMWPLIIFWAILEGIYHFFSSFCHGAPKRSTAGGVYKPAPKPWWQKPSAPPTAPRNVKDLGSMGSGSASGAPGGG